MQIAGDMPLTVEQVTVLGTMMLIGQTAANITVIGVAPGLSYGAGLRIRALFPGVKP